MNLRLQPLILPLYSSTHIYTPLLKYIKTLKLRYHFTTRHYRIITPYKITPIYTPHHIYCKIHTNLCIFSYNDKKQ